jgi:tetratricopeptide (TPR) repeat protein
LNGQKILHAAVALLVGAVAGFVFADRANRKELDELRAEVAQARAGKTAAQQGAGQTGAQPPAASDSAPAMPSEKEIRDIIAKADARSEDADYQRQVGQGVYMYSLAQNEPALMPEAIRILKRAEKADPKNFQTVLLLGNANFALAQDGDAKLYPEARAYYLRALEAKPDDANLHTLLGMTYYFGSPQDATRAIAEYRKSLAKDPRHEMALQNIVAALVFTGSLDEAGRRIEELEKVNPQNNALGNLRAQLAQARNAERK